MVALTPNVGLDIINRIYTSIEQEKSDKEMYLGRLGSSSIGRECAREVWYSWRGFSRAEFGGRILRLFETGHLQEDRVVADLVRAGFAVYEKDEAGNQFQRTDPTGHFITKIDGVILGVPQNEEAPHILEIKTSNLSGFDALRKKGVKEAKPEHYSQMQSSMKLFDMRAALYVALCKDNEQYYVEVVSEDPEEQERLMSLVVNLTESTIPPTGVSLDGGSFKCRFCDHKEVCTKLVPPLRHCRTCEHCSAVANGEWVCEMRGEVLSIEQQRKGCSEYEVF